MKIPIELLSLVFLFCIFIFWLIYKKISDWRIKKQYKKENDLSRPSKSWLNKHYPNENRTKLGEEQGRANKDIARAVESVAEPIDDAPEPSGLEGRSNVSFINPEPTDENSISNGRTSRVTKNLFSRFKRK